MVNFRDLTYMNQEIFLTFNFISIQKLLINSITRVVSLFPNKKLPSLMQCFFLQL